MSRKIEAVIFDWAGTTVDFGSFAPVQAFIEAFKQFGVQPTVEEVRQPMGMLKWNHIDTMMHMPRIAAQWEQVHGKASTKADVDAVYHASETSIMGILKDFAEPKPFVLEVVGALRSRGIKIGSTTGYTDEMMKIVAPIAKANGYAPDYYCTPNAVSNKGRPYPYMVFRNLEALELTDVAAVLKVGDTVADIQEGKNAGLVSVGVVEGSSVMALSQSEFDALTDAQRAAEYTRVAGVYKAAGADYVIRNMAELPGLIEELER